mmetsp:Transcript_67/g.227  ORF Transcript_67/g.227 Transcript_67/m.227 type:complete len:345 (-) Transcript_67:90-1124(-)
MQYRYKEVSPPLLRSRRHAALVFFLSLKDRSLAPNIRIYLSICPRRQARQALTPTHSLIIRRKDSIQFPGVEDEGLAASVEGVEDVLGSSVEDGGPDVELFGVVAVEPRVPDDGRVDDGEVGVASLELGVGEEPEAVNILFCLVEVVDGELVVSELDRSSKPPAQKGDVGLGAREGVEAAAEGEALVVSSEAVVDGKGHGARSLLEERRGIPQPERVGVGVDHVRGVDLVNHNFEPRDPDVGPRRRETPENAAAPDLLDAPRGALVEARHDDLRFFFEAWKRPEPELEDPQVRRARRRHDHPLPRDQFQLLLKMIRHAVLRREHELAAAQPSVRGVVPEGPHQF